MQGEKAYSCAQCGTRFTYRNGLIKHTKLNRCPKKIITPEGETIIKKRSRTFVSSAAATSGSKGKAEKELPPAPAAAPAAATLSPTHLGMAAPFTGALQRQPSTDLNLDQASRSAVTANATLLVQNNQVQLHANGGTYGLALLEDGSLIATPTNYEEKSSALSANVIAALSAATGLSADKISSWAANLPAGSTVKVTHHYDQQQQQPQQQQHPLPHPISKSACTLLKQTSPSISSARVQTLDHVTKHQPRLNTQNLTLEMAASACHDSLISACVGLPSYQESFAVDPNEILSKDRGMRAMIQPMIKQEFGHITDAR